MSENLINRYRPRGYKAVIGHDAVVASLQSVVKDRSAQAFLFAGPAGTGKTTLAGITARELGCDDSTITELPAAVYTGVDDMRAVLDNLLYAPFGETKDRALIVDEAHRLSGQAWDAILIATEKPPPHVYWFFCTTNVTKVPKTIKSRCATYQLEPVADKALLGLVEEICEEERYDTPGNILQLVVDEAFGSPRQAISNLAVAWNARDVREAAKLLATAVESDASYELCRFLASGGGSWTKAAAILEKLAEDSPEGVRILVSRYMAKALLGAKSDKDAAYFLRILEAFAYQFNQSDGMAPLLLSVGRAMLGARE